MQHVPGMRRLVGNQCFWAGCPMLGALLLIRNRTPRSLFLQVAALCTRQHLIAGTDGSVTCFW